MNLDDNKLINILLDYVKDNTYKQAVLIDGEWGSGKTFFIKEKLIPELKRNYSEYSILYISLYGLDSCSQLMNEIYEAQYSNIIRKNLGDSKGELLEKGLNIAGKLITTGLKYFNIDPKDLPSISDIKDIKDIIIIFDDLERCNIDVNQLLGFINNLVEHNDIQVIIVANQAEIGRINTTKDLATKYLVAMDERINLPEDESCKKDKQSETKVLNKETLINRIDKLFFEDINYNEIKEKLIGLTISYKADFNDIYESIVDKYVTDSNSNDYLKSHKQIVLEIFEKRNHHNIRTLIFGIKAYEKIFKVINEITFDPVCYLENEKEKILRYTIELSINIKLGKQLYSWKNTSAKAGVIENEDTNIFGYKFIDNYLLHHYLNDEEVKTLIKDIMNENKNIKELRESKNELSFNKLDCWRMLEDEDIITLLDQIKIELKAEKYEPSYFKNIILTLMDLKKINLGNIVYKDYINLMESKLEKIEQPFERYSLELLSTDDSLLKEYSELVKPLFDIIDEKEKESHKDSIDYVINDPWDENFVSTCKENRDKHLSEHKFLFYINSDDIIKKLGSSNVLEIYNFFDGIASIYSTSNINEFFKDDISSIRSLIEKMDIEKLSKSKVTRRIALEKLKERLQNILQNIEK